MPRSTRQTGNRRNGIDQCLECHRVVTIGAGDTQGQRHTAPVYDDVSLAAQLAPVGGVGAGFLAARGLATLAPSILARLQSIWSH